MASWAGPERRKAERRNPALGGRRVKDVGQRLRKWLDTAPRTNGDLNRSKVEA